METNEIDDILQGLGVSVPPSPPAPSQSPSEDPARETYSEDEISSILEENGFSHESPEDNGEEDIDDTDAMERASENEDAYEPTTEDLLGEPSTSEEPEEEENVREEEVSTGEESNDRKLIPLNSPTLLLDDTTSRFSGAEWFKEIQKARIIVGGCGGIGSNLVFQLARMVPANITVYDNDRVEAINMAGQLFQRRNIGKYKVDAIANMVVEYTNAHQVCAIRERFTDLTEAGDIMMCGFDNMRARKDFFQAWRCHVMSKPEEERGKCLLLDGRLSIDTLQIFCIRGDDTYNIDRYQREFLFSDSQADPTVCSMKQTTYLACMIGSLMTNLFTNFIAGTLDPIIPYDLPFFTEYDAQNMIFKTEN